MARNPLKPPSNLPVLLLVLSMVVAPGWGSEQTNRNVVRYAPSYADIVQQVQPKMVKIFGAGGMRGLESYQSGFLVSSDGFVVTAWSYVLDTENTTVILNDGRKFSANIVGADPRTELAILKIEARDVPYFSLDQSHDISAGMRVLAFSNLYGVATGNEPTSVQYGICSAVSLLSARRGTFQTPYRGQVYILDAMTNNAGAAGGALTNSHGELVGILGKELRDAQSGIWLNYALPISAVRDRLQQLMQGKSLKDHENTTKPAQPTSLEQLGIVLVPDVLAKTPPYVDQVRAGFPADQAGLQVDDLIVLIGDRTVASQAAMRELLSEIDAVDPVTVTVARQNELFEIVIQPLSRSPGSSATSGNARKDQTPTGQVSP